MNSLCQENRYKDDYCDDFVSGQGHISIITEQNALCQLDETLKLTLWSEGDAPIYFTLSNSSIPISITANTFLRRKFQHSAVVDKSDSKLINKRQTNILNNSIHICHGGIPIYIYITQCINRHIQQ